MSTLKDRNLIEEALRNWWGRRCIDFEDGCPACEAWAQYDKLLGREVHRLKANSVESRIKG